MMSFEQNCPEHPDNHSDSSTFGPSCGCRGSKTVWFIVIVIGLSLILLAIQHFEDDKSPVTSDSSIAWCNNYTDAIANAKTQNKPVLLAFTTTWCGSCREMKKKVYPDPEVVQAISSFIAVAIDPEKKVELARKYRVDGYPMYIILTPEGERVSTIIGYRKAPDFAGLLRSALEKIITD